MKENPNLDLLRAVAVALVLLSHVPDFAGVAWDFNYKTMGRMGVALFFVHTTLVLMMSLERHGPAAGPFLVRRAFRIYPLAITAVICTALLLANTPRALSWDAIVSNVLLIQNITGHGSSPNPLWTLPYEVQMYLLLPALFVFITGSNPVRRIAGLYAVALAAAALMWSGSVRHFSIGFIPCFLPGAIAFVLMRRVTAQLPPWILFAVVGAGVLAIPPLVDAGMQELPLFWALCLAVGLTIPLCRQMTWRPACVASVSVATYSYGIYITHVFVMGLTLGGTAHWAARGASFLIVQALVAWMVYRLVEAPGIRMGVRLADRLQSRQAINPARSFRPASPRA